MLEEPYEYLVIDIEDQHQGAVMEAMGRRKADLKNMEPDGQGRLRLEYIIAARTDWISIVILTMTSGTGIMSHVLITMDLETW